MGSHLRLILFQNINWVEIYLRNLAAQSQWDVQALWWEDWLDYEDQPKNISLIPGLGEQELLEGVPHWQGWWGEGSQGWTGEQLQLRRRGGRQGRGGPAPGRWGGGTPSRWAVGKTLLCRSLSGGSCWKYLGSKLGKWENYLLPYQHQVQARFAETANRVSPKLSAGRGLKFYFCVM